MDKTREELIAEMCAGYKSDLSKLTVDELYQHYQLLNDGLLERVAEKVAVSLIKGENNG